MEEFAFGQCADLQQVEFDAIPTLPHQLKKIGEGAFMSCSSLQRICAPPSVNTIGPSAFLKCDALIEANLSRTCVTEVADQAFCRCHALRTVSLPNTLGQIGDQAFQCCWYLSAVVVPLDSQPINIGSLSFYGCRRLAIISLPKGSTFTEGAMKSSFERCELLENYYAGKFSSVFDGLMNRFESFPIHQICYDHSQISVQQLQNRIAEHQNQGGLLVDEFKMTPFHILLSTAEPRGDMLNLLLKHLPSQALRWKDATGMRPVEYLVSNWINGTVDLVQRILEKSIMDPLENWGDPTWAEELKTKAGKLLLEQANHKRAFLCNEMYSTFEHYENSQATSLLELTIIWKWKLKSGRTSDGTKRLALDRDECRCLSGADVVIPHVASFLGYSAN